VRRIIFQHFDQIVSAWHEHLQAIVQSKIKPALAKGIVTTREALIIVMGPVSIPWDVCSAERNRAELSPSGYGIQWPLID
jgi:hypothetical protein